jgi:hypothetical protein
MTCRSCTGCATRSGTGHGLAVGAMRDGDPGGRFGARRVEWAEVARPNGLPADG